MEETKFTCAQCGSEKWNAVEQFTSLTPCTILLDRGEIEIEMDPNAEFQREAATSVIVAYACANENCGNSLTPDQLGGTA